MRKKLNYHAKKYYEEDNPEITDYEYDMMLRELEGIELAYPELGNGGFAYPEGRAAPP